MMVKLTYEELADMTTEDRQFSAELTALADNTHAARRFCQQLAHDLQTAHPAHSQHRVGALRVRLSMAAAVLLVSMMGLLFATPLPAMAEDFLSGFFTRTSDVETYEEPMQAPLAGPTPAASVPVYIPQSLEQARAAAAFHIKAPTYLPSGYRIVDASFEAGVAQIILIGENDVLSIVQTPVEMAEPFDIGASAEVRAVQIGPYRGEFVQGYWRYDASTGDDVLSIEGREWDLAQPYQQLLWSDSEFRYWMSSALGQGSSLPVEEWLRIAESFE